MLKRACQVCVILFCISLVFPNPNYLFAMNFDFLVLKQIGDIALQRSVRVSLAKKKMTIALKNLEKLKAEQIIMPNLFDQKEAEFGYEDAKITVEETEREVLLDTVDKYFMFLKLQERLNLKQQSYERAKNNFLFATMQFNKGLISEIDLQNFQRQVVQAKADVTVAQNELEMSKVVLLSLLGTEQKQNIDLSVVEQSGFFLYKPSVDIEKVIEMQPAIRKLEMQREMIDLKIKLADSLNTPTKAVEILQVQLEEKDTELSIEKLQQKLQVKQLWTDMANAFARIENTKLNCDFAEKNYNLLLLQYRKGIITSKSVNEAFENQASASLTKLDVIINYLLAVQKYKRFCGID